MLSYIRRASMFGWLRRRAKGLQPEGQWVVDVGPERIRVTDAAGGTTALAKADLAAVVIETNDSGPWGADLWWLLFGLGGKLAVTWPQGATGEAAVIDRLMAMRGFDHQQMIAAMASTENATFILWSPAATA